MWPRCWYPVSAQSHFFPHLLTCFILKMECFGMHLHHYKTNNEVLQRKSVWLTRAPLASDSISFFPPFLTASWCVLLLPHPCGPLNNCEWGATLLGTAHQMANSTSGCLLLPVILSTPDQHAGFLFSLSAFVAFIWKGFSSMISQPPYSLIKEPS